MDQRTKLILNSLRCPLCQSQIDLYDFYQKNIKSTSFNFCCASDWYHYRMWFPHWDNPPKISYDVVDIYEGRHKFRIDQRYFVNSTTIDIWEVDAEHHLVNEQSKIFKYDQILFDYRNTTRDKIINRIKTILTFQ